MRALLAKPFLFPVGAFCMSMTASVVFYSASGPVLAPTSGVTLLRSNMNRTLIQPEPNSTELMNFGFAPTTYDNSRPNIPKNASLSMGHINLETLSPGTAPSMLAVEQAYDEPFSREAKSGNEPLFDPASLNDIPPFAFGSPNAESASVFEGSSGGGGGGFDEGGGGMGSGGGIGSGGTIVTTAVPEASTWLMMLLGFTSIAALVGSRPAKVAAGFQG